MDYVPKVITAPKELVSPTLALLGTTLMQKAQINQPIALCALQAPPVV